MPMGSIRVRPLHGADGYLRWKESMLLVLNNAGVAHALSEDPPPPLPRLPTIGGAAMAPASAAAKRWVRDDAVCRGHILSALPDRLLPDYARHATGRALWEAVARTYGVGAPPDAAWRRLADFEFDEGKPLLEQIAHAEALGVAGHSTLADGVVAGEICQKLPAGLRSAVQMWSAEGQVAMDTIWAIARAREEARLRREAGLEGPAEVSSEEEENHHE